MELINKSFDDINEQDLLQLISLATPEIGSIEYKSKLPGATDNYKKEFLADVSSFANGSGGFIIYGMEEKMGVPIKLIGLSGLDMDNEILRLENLIRSGIAPRIPGVQSRPITLSGNIFALIVKIPKSWISPHMVTLGSSSRFFSRNSAGKYQLDVNEIRNAFVANESITNRIKEFRIDRINKVIVGETPVPMSLGAKIILHLIPINTFTTSNAIDLKSVGQNFRNLSILYTSDFNAPSDYRFNLDGLVTNMQFKDDSFPSYTQLFRNGTIEAVDTDLLETKINQDKIIPSIGIEKAVFDTCQSLLTFQKSLGIEPPILAFLTFVGVKGYRMELHPRIDWRYSHLSHKQFIDREVIQTPEVTIESYEQINISRTLHPMLDALWNAAGWAGSINYDEEGNWSERRQG